MIIIEAQAELRFLQALESYKSNLGNRTVMWLNLSHFLVASPLLLERVIEVIPKIIAEEDCQLYQFFNQDLALTGPKISQEKQQLLHDALSRCLQCELPEEAVIRCELTKDYKQAIRLGQQVIEQKKLLALEQQKRAQAKENRAFLNQPVEEELIQKMQRIRENRPETEVMVAQSDELTRHSLCNALRGHYSLTIAENGKNCLSTYLLKAPNLVFLEVDLPDLNGLDLLIKLQELDAQACIIMVSHQGNKEKLVKAIQLGAKGVLSKPFTKEKLLPLIQLAA